MNRVMYVFSVAVALCSTLSACSFDETGPSFTDALAPDASAVFDASSGPDGDSMDAYWDAPVDAYYWPDAPVDAYYWPDASWYDGNAAPGSRCGPDSRPTGTDDITEGCAAREYATFD